MELREPPDERRPELAVLENNRQEAAEALGNALAAVREVWEPETTARNLRLILEHRTGRGSVPSWQKQVEEALSQAAEHKP
jgi:hypothetical protein